MAILSIEKELSRDMPMVIKDFARQDRNMRLVLHQNTKNTSVVLDF